MKHIPKTKTAVAFLAVFVMTSAAAATPVTVALNALKFVIKKQTTIATTFAVAHSKTGTGGPKSGVSGPKVSVTGAAVSSISSDTFGPHVPPPIIKGNDTAFANAFGVSWFSWTTWPPGYRGTASAVPTTALKGDFAAAGAYARGGASATAIHGSLANTGLLKARAGFSLGGITISGSKDPGDTYHAFVVSDLDLLTLDQRLLGRQLMDVSLAEYIQLDNAEFLDTDPERPNPYLKQGIPDHTFWMLEMYLDGATGALSVTTTGESVTPQNEITNAHFQDISTESEWVYEIIGDPEVEVDMPWSDPDSSEQLMTFDEAHFEVAEGPGYYIPEPSAMVLACFGFLVWFGVARRDVPESTVK